jgi:hypothetical protein
MELFRKRVVRCLNGLTVGDELRKLSLVCGATAIWVFDNYIAQRSIQNIRRKSSEGIWSCIGAHVHPRRFVRVRPTGRNSDLAKLILGPKDPVVDCRVVDYSPGGACLEVWGKTKLPIRFELLFGGTKKRCRVVWIAGRRLGVAF